jgi:hypothetical protein
MRRPIRRQAEERSAEFYKNIYYNKKNSLPIETKYNTTNDKSIHTTPLFTFSAGIDLAQISNVLPHLSQSLTDDSIRVNVHFSEMDDQYNNTLNSTPSEPCNSETDFLDITGK